MKNVRQCRTTLDLVVRKYGYKGIYSDLRQELYLALCEEQENLDSTNIAFLYIFLRNKAIDYIKSRKNTYSYGNEHKHVSLDRLAEITHLSILSEDEQKALSDKGEHVRVANNELECEMLLERLASRSRFVMEALLDGYREREIAKVIGVSRSMVSRIKNRAIRILQDIVEGVDNGEKRTN